MTAPNPRPAQLAALAAAAVGAASQDPDAVAEYAVGPDGTRFVLPVFPLRAGEATTALACPDDGLFEHCSCCAHRRSPGGCGGPDCVCWRENTGGAG